MVRFFALLVILGGILVGFWVRELKSLNQNYPWVTYDTKTREKSVDLRPEAPKSYVKLTAISRNLRSAIILSEDSSFYEHEGVDTEALEKVLEEAWKKRKLTRGASTIPMQLIKNLYFSNDRSVLRKIFEIPMSWAMSQWVSKNRILELYLNAIEYGEGVYGIGPAARYYFKKHPSDLGPKEAAFLAMLLPNPKKYSVSFRRKTLTPFARKQIRLILWKLRAVGRISAEDFLAVIDTPLSFEHRPVAIPMVPKAPEPGKAGEDDTGPDEETEVESP